jgi:hypothetical protein
MKPKGITLISIPLEKERKLKRQRVYPVNAGQVDRLSQALRKDTMAEYVKG